MINNECGNALGEVSFNMILPSEYTQGWKHLYMNYDNVYARGSQLPSLKVNDFKLATYPPFEAKVVASDKLFIGLDDHVCHSYYFDNIRFKEN